jgi:predicted HTH domain antitoxin
MPRIRIEFPDELLGVPGQTSSSLEHVAQEAFLVRLYDLGQISSGRAAEILHIPRREFLDILNSYGVSLFDEEVDLEVEARCGR